MGNKSSGKARRGPKPNYDLRASQVETPARMVKFFWDVLRKHSPRLGSVLDMGAGDGKFARHGHYDSYLGVEFDKARITNRAPRKNAKVVQGCVFAQPARTYDACIGNPPYLRHQDIESPWKERTLTRLSTELGVALSGHSNLFLYFMALSILRSAEKGVAALLVPFDWVSRPASRELRALIAEKKWNVSVYRFSFPVFDDVETTASVSIIDKAGIDGRWDYYDVDSDLKIEKRRGVTGTGRRLLKYARRSQLFARRGMSPGTQEVFTLTEGERIHHGLKRDDVVPCVTSLRSLPASLHVLDRDAFQEHFVAAGRRCWLIKSRGDKIGQRVLAYLKGVSPALRDTATCRAQEPWYNYEQVSVPQLLLHSGFTTSPPRVLVNAIRAVPVGAMYGVYGCPKGKESALRDSINTKSLGSRIVPHSGHLRKIEVGQLNSILASLDEICDG